MCAGLEGVPNARLNVFRASSRASRETWRIGGIGDEETHISSEGR